MNAIRRAALALLAAWLAYDPALTADMITLSTLDVMAIGFNRRVTITIRVEDDAPQHPLLVKEIAVPV